MPVVVEVPHAGVTVPPEVSVVTRADLATVARDADPYVDELYRGALAVGATVVAAELSRYVVDLNRDETDVDALSVEGVAPRSGSYPRGVIWRETADGRPSLRRRLTRAEYEDRLARYYRPYHRALTAELDGLRAQYGYVVLLAAHSMPSVGRDTPGAARVRRADVVPGTRGRTTAAGRLIDAVDVHFRAAGLSVRHDEPYRGGATTARWGRPREGFHAIQVELNRALYMDEATGERKTDGFRWLATLCGGMVERLADVAERGEGRGDGRGDGDGDGRA